MKKPGPPSAASRETTAASTLPIRVRPPPNLSAPERKIFIHLVDSCAADHFKPSDLPLLRCYAEAIDLAERAACELRKSPVLDGKISPWVTVQEKAVRTIVALSLRLRLSPQARLRKAQSPQVPRSYYDRVNGQHADAYED
jgi:phage terminase small subunit